MIKGLGMYYRETGVPLDIHFVRKGLHVKEAEALVGEQGLNKLVTWHAEMSLISVWKMFSECDIVFEQLGSSMIGMAGFDAMAAGRPVIGNMLPNVAANVFQTTPPICQAKTPVEVFRQLKALVSSPEHRRKIGLLGRQYVENHCSPQYAAIRCLKYFDNSAGVDNLMKELLKGWRGYSIQQRFENGRSMQKAFDQLKTLQEEFNRYAPVRWAYKISCLIDSFLNSLRNNPWKEKGRSV